MPSLYELQKRKDVDAIIRILRNSKNEAVRARAVEILGEIGGERAIRELINVVISDDSEMVKSSAAKSIAWADEKALKMFLEKIEGVKIKGATWVLVNYLIKALKSKDKNIRMHAAIALGRIGDDRAVPHLIDALNDKSPAVRRAAAIALGMIGNNAAVDALLKRLNDEDVEVRKAALESLTDLNLSKKDIEKVKESLKDPDPRVRELAAMVLEKGGEAAVEALLEAIEDKVREVRVTATQSLLGCLARVPVERSEVIRKKVSDKMVKAKDVAEVVIEVLDKAESGAIKKNAIWLLGQLGDPKGLEPLLKVLERGTADEKRLAATSLVKMGSNAVDRLGELIKHSDEEVRRLVCWILGEIGDIRAKEILNLALEDPSDRVRSVAFQAINKVERFNRGIS